jgi:uncharacterized protein (DUF4213/DUF364 family)
VPGRLTTLDVLLADLPAGWEVEQVTIGANWVLSVVASQDKRRAGLASAPDESAPWPGALPRGGDAARMAQRAASADQVEAAAGLATLNALLQPAPEALTAIDAADWLAEHGQGKGVAIFGRFPFIEDEIKPSARRVWVFEREPADGEYGERDIPAILPQADIVAITSSTLVNQTLDGILAHVASHSTLMMLGAGTPLSPRLFARGFDLLSGVIVRDIGRAMRSVEAGVSFRQMEGLQRVTLCKPPTLPGERAFQLHPQDNR